VTKAGSKSLGVKIGRTQNERIFPGLPLPADVPANPRGVYLNNGWSSWGDWLGTEKVAPGQHPSPKAASAVGNFNAPDPAFSGKLSQA
jgi:hypothetical protein